LVLRSTLKKAFLLLAWLVLALPLRAETNAPLRPGAVREIAIVVRRVDPDVIRRELAFKEGDELTEDKIEESRKNLHRLGLLKTLDVETTWDNARGGYKVTVKADDGWFILPMPMVGSRGGESFAGLMLMERNFFRRSEGLMLFGSFSEGRTSAMASLFLPHFFLMGGLDNSLLDQYEYADGGYNSKQFDGDSEREEPEDFGTITNQYKRDIKKVNVFGGGRIVPWLRTTVGLSHSEVEYDEVQSSDPGDTGDINAWTLSLNVGREGRGDAGSQGGFFGSFGRIFGLGMAGVKDSLRPLPKNETTRNLLGSVERGEDWLGSDFEYTKGMLSASQVTMFRNRSMLSLSVKGGMGDDLPASQQLSTSQRGLLAGVYAREYRGDSIAAGSAVFTRPFFRSIVGVLNAEVFGDYAVCWAEGGEWKKEGIGINVAYRFWRFPLPLGSGITYSFDDDNWQYSWAMGGMF
jgi:outer membrane protein assembly factor BamA